MVMKTKGQLIVIDGTDGSGKATQVKRLVERFRAEGRAVETLDFPRYEDNFFGSLLGRCLAGIFGDWKAIVPHIASVLYACDRWESSSQIKNWLELGKIVILDRYVSSNQIHQAGKIGDDKAREEFLEWLDKMEHMVLGLPRPDLIIYLDVPLEITQKLLKDKAATDKKKYLEGGTDQHESDLQHLSDAKESGLKMIKARNNWKRIDCSNHVGILPIEVIHEKVWQIINTV
jgi:dTMP kinase